MKVVITGGHHSSALPLIDLIKKEDLSFEIVWFGHKYSMRGNRNPTLEYRQINSRNIPFIEINAGKFYKTYNPFRLMKIPWGFIQALYYLLRFKPDIVLSFGGYLAVPVVLSAWLLRIPVITHEQTVVTGYANKFISIFADKILISHEQSKEFFPKEKTIYSGIPLRESLFQVKSNSFVFENDLPVIYITAGKTGSHKINIAIISCLSDLLKNFNLIHQCGDHSEFNDYDKLSDLKSDLENQRKGKYYLRKFVYDDEIGEVFDKADLFLSRAGAHTTYEIKAFRKPAVLVPIPWTSHNEQYKNARILAEENLGVILEEDELTCSAILGSLREALAKKINNKNFEPKYNQDSLRVIISTIRNVYKEKKKKEK